jgi:phosphatidylglycerophosphate synthase
MLELEWARQRYDEITSIRKRCLAVMMVVLTLACAGVYWYYTKKEVAPVFMVMIVCLLLVLFQKTKRIAELELKLAEERNKNSNHQSA